jgi:hypothetical protein
MDYPMSIEAICNNKMNTALKKYGEDVAVSVIEILSSKYGFSADDALSSFSLTVSEKRIRPRSETRPSSRGSTRSSVAPSILPIPFCGESVDGWCSGIRPNGGLYTQCSNEPDGDSPYCSTCQRQASKNVHGLPNGGDIGDRIGKGDEWRCPKGKMPIRLANYLKKSGKELTDELRTEISEAAKSFGWTISDEEWVVKTASRGRPRKTKTAVVDTTATEDESDKKLPENKKKTSRKVKKTNSGSELENASDSSDGEELVLAAPSNSSLTARRLSKSPIPSVPSSPNPSVISPIEAKDSGSISPIVAKESTKVKKPRKPKMTPEEKEAARAAKAAAKLAEKEAARAAKAAAKQAEKEKKAAEKAAEKKKKAAEKAAAKQAEKEKKAAEKEKKAVEEKSVVKDPNGKELNEKLFGPPSPSEMEEEGAQRRCSHTDSDGSRCSTPSEGNGNSLCTKHMKPEDRDHEIYEAETESEDSDDEDAVGVEEFEHKEKKYLRDPESNDIYDHAVFMKSGDTQQIGVYNPETDEIEFMDEE